MGYINLYACVGFIYDMYYSGNTPVSVLS